MRVADRIADAVAAAGATQTFGLLGSGNLRLVVQLRHAHRMPFTNAQHETVGLGMADGYARATETIGWASVTAGPGFTHALTGLVTAQRARTPLVVLTGDSSSIDPRRDPFGLLQGADQAGVAAVLGIPFARVTPSTIDEVIGWAATTAWRDQTPVLVAMPTELQHAALPDDYPPPPTSLADWQVPLDRVGAAERDVALVVQLLESSKRPVLLAGWGAARSGAGEVLRELASATGALLVTSLRADGLFRGDPFDAGIAGGYSRRPISKLLGETDLVIGFGASMNNLTTRQMTQFGSALMVHVDNDSHAIARHTDAVIPLVGDARTVAGQLLGRVHRTEVDSRGFRTPEVREVLQDPERFTVVEEDGRVDPRALCQKLNQVLPERRILVTDGGHCSSFAIEYIEVEHPKDLMSALDFGATGGGLGVALGASAGLPDVETVLVTGDGGLLMTLGDLDTAVKAGSRVLIVCLDDDAYGSEVLLLKAQGLPTETALIPTPDLVQVAEGMGMPAARVENLEDLAAVEDQIARRSGPFLLHCKIARTVVSRTVEDLLNR